MRRSKKRRRARRDLAPQSHITASTASAARARITRCKSTILRNSIHRRSKNCRPRADVVATSQFADAKRGARRLPFLSFYAGSSRKLRGSCCVGFASDAHRMRGVISMVFALSPVESYASFRSSLSLQQRVYAPVLRNSREILKCKKQK